ncbi:MAG: hypothetical protein K0R38_7630 [Polyangiaceae bacterium]|nr:hypothetical protein [Polyangiaceae bacterium]
MVSVAQEHGLGSGAWERATCTGSSTSASAAACRPASPSTKAAYEALSGSAAPVGATCLQRGPSASARARAGRGLVAWRRRELRRDTQLRPHVDGPESRSGRGAATRTTRGGDSRGQHLGAAAATHLFGAEPRRPRWVSGGASLSGSRKRRRERACRPAARHPARHPRALSPRRAKKW